MIARIHRFRGRASLNYVYAHGRTVRGQTISLKFVFNQKRREFRCAVVVSRKIHKSAVSRNRLRRRIYEIVRANSQRIDKPYDMVFTVFNERALDFTPKELRLEIGKLLAESNIIRQGQDDH